MPQVMQSQRLQLQIKQPLSHQLRSQSKKAEHKWASIVYAYKGGYLLAAYTVRKRK